jgi:hypothetical protein
MSAKIESGVVGEYPTTPLLLDRTPKKHNVLIGNDSTQIRFAEQYLSMAHGILPPGIKHEAVPVVNDEMLEAAEPKLYLVERSNLIDVSPQEKAKIGIWSLDLIERDSKGINAIVRYAAKLLGKEKLPKDVVARVGLELVKESDHGKRYLLTDIRAAVWQAVWLLTGPDTKQPSWLRPWENWQMWMPRGGDPRYRLNALYRELVMWVFAQSGDDKGFRKTGGGWDAKRFSKLAQLQLPKDKVYDTLLELSAWRKSGNEIDPFVCVIRISKIWETK